MRILVILVLLFESVIPASADLFIHSWENYAVPRRTFRLAPTVSYYTTNTNFNASGTAAAVPNLTSYSRIGVDLLASWGVAERLTLFQRISWSGNMLQTSALQSNGYGFADQMTGLGFRIAQGDSGLALDLQAQVEYPFYTNSVSQTEGTPMLGDQSIDATGGLFLTVPLHHGSVHLLDLTMGGAFTWRSLGYSAAAPWTVNLDYRPARSGWLSSLGANGFLSLNDATNSLPPGFGTGGSFITQAKDASIAQGTLKTGYAFASGAQLTLSGGLAFYGENAPKGYWVALGARFDLCGGEETSDAADLNPEQYGKSNQGFLEYTSEAQVTATNDRMSLVKINKGSESGINVGQTFDIFRSKPDGTAGDAVARGRVTSVKPGEAVITIKEYFKEVWIEKGFIVKRPLK